MNDEDLRLACLKLAMQMVGPWERGRVTKHAKLAMGMAVAFKVYVQEDMSEAVKVLDNKLDKASVVQLKLVDRS